MNGGGSAFGFGGNVQHRELWVHIDGLPNGAFDLEGYSGLVFVVGGNGDGFSHGATVVRRVELDGDVAGFAGFDLTRPLAGGSATAGGLNVGDHEQLGTGVSEDEGVFHWFAGFHFAEIVDRSFEADFRPCGTGCGRGGSRSGGDGGRICAADCSGRNGDKSSEKNSGQSIHKLAVTIADFKVQAKPIFEFRLEEER
jgi:hypothetical protein